jgi:chromosome partitioning protein
VKVFSISNQKGGVGKTTTAVNISASLVTLKKKVLLIDLDPQCNATSGCGIERYGLSFSIAKVLLGKCSLSQAIIRPENMQFDLLPSDSDLLGMELQLANLANRERILSNALKKLEDDAYDIVVIDSPPALGLLSLNALVAANSVIIPVQCEYYSLEGLSDLLNTIEAVKQTYNQTLEVDCVIRTMYDPRSRLSRDVSNQLFRHFSDKVMKCTIPRTIRLAEAPSHGRSIVDYDANSSGSIAYQAMANELLSRKLI